MAPRKGSTPPNKINRVGIEYGKLIVLSVGSKGKWRCECVCGNVIEVLSTNLSNYAKNNRGCRHCGGREDISEERRGLVVAEGVLDTGLTGRRVWVFRCDCGGSIEGTVGDFRFGKIRSCGCHDCAYNSWMSMMNRCYDKTSNRYNSYGGRGITVCERWHTFENFVEDMGERPKDHNLSRKRAEEGYQLDNCEWEHISRNSRDTKNDGMPTTLGWSKGAKPRD